jgi:hypothetical protein
MPQVYTTFFRRLSRSLEFLKARGSGVFRLDCSTGKLLTLERSSIWLKLLQLS